jgi:hypothetical protein
MRNLGLAISATLLLSLGAWGQAPTTTAPATGTTTSSANQTMAKKGKAGHRAGRKQHKKHHKAA